jgi:hypothetical protein
LAALPCPAPALPCLALACLSPQTGNKLHRERAVRYAFSHYRFKFLILYIKATVVSVCVGSAWKIIIFLLQGFLYPCCFKILLVNYYYYHPLLVFLLSLDSIDAIYM